MKCPSGMLKQNDMEEDVRSYNVGGSDYSKHKIQPWTIWIEYGLNPFDADIVKRVLRKKEENGMTKRESRKLDYEKIIHICKERLRQLEDNTDPWGEFNDVADNAEMDEGKEILEGLSKIVDEIDDEPSSHSNGIIDGRYYRCKNTCYEGRFKAGEAYLAQNGFLLNENSRAMFGKNALENNFELVE